MAARSTSRRWAFPSGLPRTDRSMSARQAASRWAFSCGEGVEARHRDQEVPPPEAHQALDVALLVAPGHPAEVVGEEEVALQTQELPGEVAVAAHHLGDGDPGVVIADAGGHAAEEGEARHVPGLEGLGALSRIGRDVEDVRVRQGHDRQGRLHLHAGDDHGGLAEVVLGLARRMGERDEDLSLAFSGLCHLGPDLG